MGSIYIITNKVNGKRYVGQTAKDPEQRWCDYSRKLTPKQSKRPRLIEAAIMKYGLENFSFDVIETCDEAMLDAREMHWISELGTYWVDGCGYNMTHGGHGQRGLRHTEEWCSKVRCPVSQFSQSGQFIAEFSSLTNAGKTFGIDRSAISKCCKRKRHDVGGFIWRFKGDVVLDADIDNMCMKNIKYKRRVCQYGLDGSLVSTYRSAKHAADFLGNVASSTIVGCCTGRKMTYKGYIWRFEGDVVSVDVLLKASAIIHGRDANGQKRRAIDQLTIDGTFIQRFKSIKDASRSTNVGVSIILHRCLHEGFMKSTDAYSFRFSTDVFQAC